MTTLNRRMFLGAIAGNVATTILAKEKPERIGVDLKVAKGPAYPDLPKGALRRLGLSGMRTVGGVSAVRFSHNSKILLAAEGEELRGWDPATGKLLFRYGYPEGISPQSGQLTGTNTLAVLGRPTSGGKYEMHHYDLTTGKFLSRSQPLGMDGNQHNDVARDGSMVAIIQNNHLYVYDAKSGAEKWTGDLPNESVGGCRFFDDGSRLALAKKEEILLYNTADGKKLPSLPLGEFKHDDKNGWNWLTSIHVSGDGLWAAATVGEEEYGVGVWDIKARKFLHLLKPATSIIGFLPNQATILTYTSGRVTLWDIKTGAKQRTITTPNGTEVHLAPSGRWLGTYAGDAVQVIEVATGKPLVYSAGPPDRPARLWFRDAQHLVGSLPSWGGWVEWDLKQGAMRLLRSADGDGLTAMSIADHGQVGLFQAKEQQYVVHELATGKTLHEVKLPEQDRRANNSEPVNLLLTPDAKRLLASTGTGLVMVDLGTKKRTEVPHRLSEMPQDGVIFNLAANGRTVALAPTRQESLFVDLYDIRGPHFIRRITLPGSDLFHLSMSADGRWLAVAHSGLNDESGRHSALSVFDTETGRAILSMSSDQSSEAAMHLSPDGRLLVCAQAKEVLAIIEVGVGKRSEFHVEHHVHFATISPDGRILATSQSGGPVVLWDLYPKPSGNVPDRAVLSRLWDQLRSAEAASVGQGINMLIHHPKMSVPYLREQIMPVPETDMAVIEKHIAALDHNQFRRRELAYKALQELGELAFPMIRDALAKQPSPEAAQRLDKLLQAEVKITPEQRRLLRAIEIVERINTKDAHELLTSWSRGARGALLTRESHAALQRLGQL